MNTLILMESLLSVTLSRASVGGEAVVRRIGMRLWGKFESFRPGKLWEAGETLGSRRAPEREGLRLICNNVNL